MATLTTAYDTPQVGLISDSNFVCTVATAGVKIFDLNTGDYVGIAGLGSCIGAAINRHGIYLIVSVATGVRFLPASTGYVGDQTANLQIISTPELSAAYNTGVSASGGALALVHTNGIDLFPDSSDLTTRYNMTKTGITDIVIRGDRLAFASGGEVFFSELPKRSWDHEFMIQAGSYLTPSTSVAVRMPNQLAHMMEAGETGVGRMVSVEDNLVWYTYGTAYNFYLGKMTTFGPYSRNGKAKGTWSTGSFQGMIAPRNNSDFDGAVVRWAILYRFRELGDETWMYEYAGAGLGAGVLVYTRQSDPNTVLIGGTSSASVISKIQNGNYSRISVGTGENVSCFDDTYFVEFTSPNLKLYTWDNTTNDRYTLRDTLDLNANYGYSYCNDLFISGPYLFTNTNEGNRRFYIGQGALNDQGLTPTFNLLPSDANLEKRHLPGVHVSHVLNNGGPVLLYTINSSAVKTLIGSLEAEVENANYVANTVYQCGDYYALKYSGGDVGFFRVGPALTPTVFTSIVDLKISKDACFVAVPGEGMYVFTLDDPTPQLFNVPDAANLKSIAPSDFADKLQGLVAFSTTNDSGILDMASPE